MQMNIYQYRQYVPSFQNYIACFPCLFSVDLSRFRFMSGAALSSLFSFPGCLFSFSSSIFFCFFCTLLHDTLDWMSSQKSFDKHDNWFVFHSCIHVCFPGVLEEIFSLAFHPSEVNKMSTRNFWKLSGKK